MKRKKTIHLNILIMNQSILANMITRQSSFLLSLSVDSPTVDEASSRDLWRTVGIAVGVSSGYLLLVAGLSFYVEWRRSKRPSKKSEVKKVSVSPASANGKGFSVSFTF